jgi:ABC-type lipoprotein release transport system permease subunit
MADWAAVRMLRRHRQWAILITVAVGVLVAAGVVTLTVVENVSKGPAYQKAANYVRSGRGS